MKLIRYIFIFLFSVIIFCGCVWDRGIILFNNEPITKENVLNNNLTFTSGQRIYYLFIAPERMSNKYIRVQVFKLNDKDSWGGADVIRTKDYRLMKDERYYHTDYFTIYEAGRYGMQVFSTDDCQHPLSVGQFYVK